MHVILDGVQESTFVIKNKKTDCNNMFLGVLLLVSQCSFSRDD